MFSRACEYSIRATILIATHSMVGERVSLKDIARKTDSPLAFTGKVLQQLVKGGIVTSVQGVNGGFEIGQKQMEETRLSQIVAAIDGEQIFRACGLGLQACNAKKPCPLHDKFASIRNDLKTMLEGTSILDLSTGLKDGLTFLQR
ncbi:MAG: Rrf2 family transcriptional regulator [Saprospiraceae bacterium]|nr:Rrf2 family transcriptional regulator [Saprospiraceae bacterium]MCF8248974.1 Rrf2 family transcriptional regulator [Saprospiraceae bacterium]MCF8279185.1 Rrf2 family transcriptional regulator [Bacteroidales bacterium]MCF8310868.1 Rrf2 family transcriptional regulator [Saprospiraceae bacterium]MCF8439544.1 Rrf2 family transcriptional regulator [Saprospiraceae bacterium]